MNASAVSSRAAPSPQCAWRSAGNPFGIVVRDNHVFTFKKGNLEPIGMGMESCTDLSPFIELKPLATLGTASMSGAQQAGSNEDEAAIRKVIVEMTDGFNNHDGKAAARMYTRDARFVSVRGDMMNSQAGIEKGLSAILATRARNTTQRTMDV